MKTDCLIFPLKHIFNEAMEVEHLQLIGKLALIADERGFIGYDPGILLLQEWHSINPSVNGTVFDLYVFLHKEGVVFSTSDCQNDGFFINYMDQAQQEEVFPLSRKKRKSKEQNITRVEMPCNIVEETTLTRLAFVLFALICAYKQKGGSIDGNFFMGILNYFKLLQNEDPAPIRLALNQLADLGYIKMDSKGIHYLGRVCINA